MNILSISDVITNSSSEVFIITADKETNDRIISKIDAVCEAAELNYNDDIFTSYIESEDSSYYDLYSTKKGDLVIRTGENSMPYWLQSFIEDLQWDDSFENKIQGFKQYHI